MTSRLLVLLLIAAFAAIPDGNTRAQDLGSALAGLEAPRDTTRYHAFYQLLGGYTDDAGAATRQLLAENPVESDRISVALIELLHRENSRLQLEPPMMTERDAMYHGDVVWAVAAVQDPRAIPALLEAVGTGMLAARGLARLGEEAIPALRAGLNSMGRNARAGIVQALGLMLDEREAISLGKEGMMSIRAALLAAVDDEVGHVREMAMRPLGSFRDPEVRRVMARLAEEDPYTRPREGRPFHPIREAERDWLRQHATTSAQTADPAVGGYEIEVGPWDREREPSLAKTQTPPRVFRLCGEVGGYPELGRMLVRPLVGQGSMARAMWDRIDGDSIRVAWWQALHGVSLRLELAEDSMRGTARALTDHEGAPVPTAPVTGRRIDCEGTGLPEAVSITGLPEQGHRGYPPPIMIPA